MALIGQPNVAFCLLEGRPLHNVTTTMSDKVSQVLEQTDGLGASTLAFAPVGQFQWEAVLEGFYDTGAGLAQEGLELTGDQVLMYALAGNAIGDPFTGIEGPHGEITTLMERGKFHRTRANFKAHLGPQGGAHDIILPAALPVRSYVQAPYAIVTDVGPTNLATLDWGAGFVDQETGSAIGFLGVSALVLDGGADILFTIQDSNNDIAYVDLIVFTAVAAAAAGERVAAAAAAIPGDIERYTQLMYEFRGGAGALRSCTFAVGLVRSFQ